MTEQAVSYCLRANQSPAHSGNHPQMVWNETVVQNLDDLSGSSGNLSQGIIPISAYGSRMPLSQLEGIIENSGTAFQTIHAHDYGATALVEISGAVETNGAAAPFFFNSTADAGRQTFPVALVLAGNALAAAQDGGAITVGRFKLSWQYPRNLSYQGWYHVMDFEDFPPDTLASGSNFMQTLLNRLANGNNQLYQVGATAGNVPIYVQGVSYAGIAPEGAVFIRPEDIGANPDQIPAAIVDNTAANFRAHPSVFLRRTNYWSGITRQNVDPDPVDVGNGQPFWIYSVTQAPDYSDWLIVLDGMPQLVRLTHPSGSDFRRPRDIWNNVWVPIINGSSAPSVATLFQGYPDTTQMGQTLSTRFKFMEYARCIGIPNTTTITQSGVG